jgi:hypothetical protein
MVTRNFRCGRDCGRAGRRPRPVPGAHASRAVATASGDGPVGVEALGRFDAMLVLVRSGNVRRKPSSAGVDACAPWMSVLVLEVADWRKPAMTEVTGLSARVWPAMDGGPYLARAGAWGMFYGWMPGAVLDQTSAWFVRRTDGADCRVGSH